jgi:NAD(P)-dependent dehydrogenase (short-subunit alcohol dehydrogenase family)
MMAKTILITGASSGIGKATAKLFHERGWNVIATMRSPEKESELTDLDNVLVTRLDVVDPSSIKEAFERGVERFGKIDVLLNNAGYGAYGPLEAFPPKNIRRQFDVNVLGLLAVTQEVLPHFRKHRDGIVINISSVGGKITFPLGTLYHGTKFAVEGISEALNFELEQFDCRVKIVEPGFIRTDFAGRSFDFVNDESMIDYQELVGRLFQSIEGFMANASEPSVVAEVVYQAATDGTGQLRYTAGEDARQIVEARRSLSDDEFLQNIKAQFGLET